MSTDRDANLIIEEAILCKLFKCTPNQLQEMDWDKVEYYATVYREVIKDNPLAMLM
jgi:hypothetical protein